MTRPDPASEATRANSYCFEHPVTFIHTGAQSRGFIDLYRAGHFVMEAKQGKRVQQGRGFVDEVVGDQAANW